MPSQEIASSGLTPSVRGPRRGCTPPDRSDEGVEEEADGVTAARRWRGVCRMFLEFPIINALVQHDR